MITIINRPSNLFRRAMCPGSGIAEAEFLAAHPEAGEGGAAAMEGKLIHTMIENDIAEIGDVGYDTGKGIYKTNPQVRYAAQIYMAESEGAARIMTEQPLALDHIGMPGGTADVLLLFGDGRATIIDWKTGHMRQDRPKYNWQMKAYASGVIRLFPEVREVKVVVAYTRLEEVEDHTFPIDEIERAEYAINGIVSNTDTERNLLVPSDTACQFCMCKLTCSARTQAIAQVQFLTLPSTEKLVDYLKQLPPDRSKQFYLTLRTALAWCKDAKESIDSAILDGDMTIDGFTVGTGRCSYEWMDTVNGRPVEQALKGLGLEPFEQKLKSVAVIRKEAKALGVNVEPMVVKRDGKPTVKGVGCDA